MKVVIPEGKYIKQVQVNESHLDIEFSKRKKVALLFIGLNERYWPYLKQVIQDCKQNFLPQHKVDYLLWTDLPQEDTPDFTKHISELLTEEQLTQIRTATGAFPSNQFFSREVIQDTIDFIRQSKDIHILPTGSIDWPAPTLMRYHLFLQQEEKLKEYDYIFYLDADMRVVEKISDEILGEGLTAAPHPGYYINKKLIPPLEPNSESAAYIHRLGNIVDDEGKPRFMPFYAAGGFQGGVSSIFLEAMKLMKDSIDKDFDRNYIAIWNDESHWNKFLWEYQKQKGKILFLDPSYVYPDSLINEYYVPIWGRNYSPKIITLTKPFSLSKQAGSELNQLIGNQAVSSFQCPICKNTFQTPGYTVKRVVQCPGSGKEHQLEMIKT